MQILNELKKEEIKSLYLSGLCIKGVHKKLNISEQLISNFLKENNLTRIPRKRGSELEKAKLKAKNMYENGNSIYDISVEMNLSYSMISNYIKSCGLKLATRIELSNKKIGDYKQQIKELYEKGYNSYEIGEKLNKSYKTILHHLKKMEVERRPAKKINDEKFKEMWNNGATDDEFMKEFDISRATIRGYRSRNDYHTTQWFSQTEQKLSEIQEQMILGSLLGDMSIRYDSKGKNASLCLVHCMAQEELFMKKVEILGIFMGSYRLSNKKPDPRTGKIYLGYRGSSKAHPVFKKIYDLLYPNRKKTITKEYLDKISHPIALAYWFMDDGSYKGDLATNSFNEYENDLLVSFLKEKFNINSHKRINKLNQYIIQIEASSRRDFENLISPYFVETMKYKLKHY